MTRAWLRVTAWVVGAIAFFGPWAALGLSPKPDVAAAAPPDKPQRDRPRRVIHRVIRRVIITQAAPVAPSGVNVVYTGGGGGGYSGGGSSGGGGGGGTATTGGS